MALRMCNRIDKTNITRNLSKLLLENAKLSTEVTDIQNENPTIQAENKNDHIPKLNVGSISSKQRTSSPENPRLFSAPYEPESEIIHRNMENMYLQPATLPDYCSNPVQGDQFSIALQEAQMEQLQDIALSHSASQCILESFKKEKTKNFATKFHKLLSNPFPDPVKATFSPHILSDQDKAQQMLDDQKIVQLSLNDNSEKQKFTTGYSQTKNMVKPSKKFYGTGISPSKATPTLKEMFALQEELSKLAKESKRFYSLYGLKAATTGNLFDYHNTTIPEQMKHRFASNATKNCNKNEENKKKCLKQKSCLTKKCPKMTIKGCPPPRANTICKPINIEVKCQKIEAPYPSYSESCYMEPKVRQTECENCHWTSRKHPYFKGKVKLPSSGDKKYHTCSKASTISPQQNMGRNLDAIARQYCMKQSQNWIQTANLSQTHNEKINSEVDYYHLKKIGNVEFHDIRGGGGTDEVDPNKWEKISVRRRKNASRKPIDYLNSVIPKTEGEMNNRYRESQYGYSNKPPTVLSEFLMKNDDLVSKFRNGDDLKSFVLAAKKISNPDNCNRRDNYPDYPRSCEVPPKDNSKICPPDLTVKKTNRDRLKKKKPKA